MDRPTVIQCQATLGDGTTCNVDVPVQRGGNIPKYCKPHRPQRVRELLEREAKRSHAGDTAAEAADPNDGVRVCRPRSCFIPLADTWNPEFCPAHWRLLSTEVKGGLLAAERGTERYDVQVLRALREISKVEGRAGFEGDQEFDEPAVLEVG